MDEEFSTSGAAAYLGITRQGVLAAVKRGEIGTLKRGLGTSKAQIYVFTRSELDAWKAGALERRRRSGKKRKG